MSQMGEESYSSTIDELDQSHWVQVEYQYSNGQAVKGSFLATDSDGIEWLGILNDKGQACLSFVPAGSVEFQLLRADDLDADIKATRSMIKIALDDIIAEQISEAARHGNQLNEQGTWGKIGSYGSAAGRGLWHGAVGLVTFVGDLAKKAYLLTPIERLNNLLHASYSSYRDGELTYNSWRQSLVSNYQDEEFKDLAEILGIDVRTLDAAKIERIKRQLVEAYEITAFIADDPESLEMITNFAKDYAGTQSSIEWAEFGGTVVFEIIVAVLTAGIGTAANVRHAAKLRPLVRLFSQLGKLLKRKKLKKNVTVSVDSKKRVTTDLPPDKKLITKPDKRLKKSKVDCFKKNKKGTPEEYDRQLKGQQDGLSNMSAKEYMDGRNAYSSAKRASTVADRNKFQNDLIKKYLKNGMSKTEALTTASNKMKTMHALHNPDMIAGGTDVISGFGDGSVNQSIGAQWKKRVSTLDEAAKKAIRSGEGDFKMNPSMHRCE